MKRILFILFTVFVVYTTYKFNTSPGLRTFYRAFFDYPNETVFYKDLKNSKDLNGRYRFSCNYPENYNVIIGFNKDKVLIPEEGFISSEKKKVIKANELFGFKIKVDIISKDGVLFSKIVDPIFFGFSSINKKWYMEDLLLVHKVTIENCNDITMNIKVIKGDFGKYDNKEGLFYLYVRYTKAL